MFKENHSFNEIRQLFLHPNVQIKRDIQQSTQKLRPTFVFQHRDVEQAYADED